MQKKSEKAENENIEETITGKNNSILINTIINLEQYLTLYNHRNILVKLENTENENIEMIEIEEHNYDTMTIPNPSENFGVSPKEMAHYSGNGKIK